MRKLKVNRASSLRDSPKRPQQNQRKSSVSATMATPRMMDTMIRPPMFHVSGFREDLTWSVARATLVKSVMKLTSSIENAETTNFPVTT